MGTVSGFSGGRSIRGAASSIPLLTAGPTPAAVPQPEAGTGRHRYGIHADTPDVPTFSEAGQKDYAITKLISLG
ncbi:hypothetical protein CBM2592_P350002 [Cupriavidus taiwanensis]|uniref:Uncharacterized protein n=2 Tax=Cupriavidus TaxID=106589 RepID=A0A375HWE1_9BURK|nr:hypothetical protein CBM2588_P260002 [Cupriavidus taiwanensis]SOZ40628.1 hypothetical protein CBM2605_P320003 [Cupriavidus neocaledonicus]SOY75867.1 hypothetical protein CBM2589_P240002 [Cupriavidus taiwanensis]SOY75901.1 hypothetical protein CBM2592_P350002 [Cupriavidus taiwanensis]SOZ92760.1 hypothetical protein CBM2622_P250002 [Cupriavidus taiwanensis]